MSESNLPENAEMETVKAEEPVTDAQVTVTENSTDPELTEDGGEKTESTVENSENKSDAKEKPAAKKRRTRKKNVPADTAEDSADKPEKEKVYQLNQETLQKLMENAVSKALEDQERLFEKRRVHAATKDERMELYKSETVVTDFGEKAVTEADERKAEYQYLMEAARANPKPILKGVVEGVEQTENNFLIATVSLVPRKKDDPKFKGYFKIKIPVDQMFEYDVREYLGPDGFTRLRDELVARIHSETHFCVFDVDEKLGIAFASRLMAQTLRTNGYYIKPQSDGEPRVKDGMIVQAKVIAVKKGYLRVDVLGIDTTIKSGDLSWNALAPLQDEYQKGDRINVKVSDIKFHEYKAGSQTYILGTMHASAKDATRKPSDLFFDDFIVGGIYGGEIKAEASETGVFVRLNGKMDALCDIPSSNRAVVGKKCTVLIKSKNIEKRQLSGVIIDL